MKHTLELRLPPAEAADPATVRRRALEQLFLSDDSQVSIHLIRRSIDARGRMPLVELALEVYDGEATPETPNEVARLATAARLLATPAVRKRVIIVGAGPAGYFAALELLMHGIQPIILERGKDVQARRRDLRAIQQFGIVNPHSNYCYGEGGAGTYSDGKLYTRSVKRGDWRRVLRMLVEHGADPDILVDTHPHIGSNKLPKVVAAIRATIESFGGEVRFEHYVTDLLLEAPSKGSDAKHAIAGVVVDTNGIHTELRADAVILATGHSARDIYQLLDRRHIRLEAKPFALGVRIEHPQTLIDEVQYRQKVRDVLLPASSYKLVCQVKGRGVFSFCMCPGGLVVPAATAAGEIVVNGMSMSRRDSEYANSGTVTAVELSDFAPYAAHGVFAGMAFQQAVEQRMFAAGGDAHNPQKAPAQRLTDFVAKRVSASLPSTSYIPGLVPAPLHDLLPAFIYDRLREGVVAFGKQMRGYYTEEANVIGTESRTSSPVRIPRDPITMMHPDVSGLFPTGEGAGFAGGILSAAMDGQNAATAVAGFLGVV